MEMTDKIWLHRITRKPCYDKDDHAIRPIYGCTENVWEDLPTPMATFPEMVNGLLLRYKIWSSWDNRGTPKIWAVPGHAHTPFSPDVL